MRDIFSGVVVNIKMYSWMGISIPVHMYTMPCIGDGYKTRMLSLFEIYKPALI